MGVVGDVTVESPLAFTTEDGDVEVRKGPTRSTPSRRSPTPAPGTPCRCASDFERVANHQRLLLGVLERLRAAEDEEGFMEAATLAALGGLETDLSPTAAYRIVQALTTIDPRAHDRLHHPGRATAVESAPRC